MPEQQDRRALYLRWRPQTFSEVVGQEHVTRTLRNAVRLGKLAHAYLLCGPRGTGKTSLARILYRAANCINPVDGDPCGTCPICVSALAGRAMDLVEIDAASNRGIEDIRQLRERIGYAPSEGRYRVYIVDEAHELTAPAWDAFLKTLEEPPAHAIFVLATTEAHKVPPTIVSRCQRFDLRRIGLSPLRARLALVADEEGLQVEDAVLDTVARQARGGLRDALSLLDQLRAYAGERIDLVAARSALGLASAEAVQGVVEALEQRDARTALDLLAGTAEEGADLRQFAADLISYLRGLLLASTGAGQSLSGEFSAEDVRWLRAHAERWSVSRLLGLTRSLAETAARTRDGVQLEYQLQVAFVEQCSMDLTATSLPGGPAAQGGSPEVGRSTSPPAASSVPVPRHEESSPIPQSRPERARPESVESDGPNEAVAAGLEGGAREGKTPGGEAAAAAPEPSDPLVAASGTALSLQSVRARWSVVMDALRERNSLVAAMLEHAQLLALDQKGLHLGFAFPFHLKRMNELKNRHLVEDVLASTLGQTVVLVCEQHAPDMEPLEPGRLPDELASLVAEDPVLRRAVDLWGEGVAIVE